VGRLLTLLLIVGCFTGCWNSRDGVRADWGKGGLFSKSNAQARSKDRATNDSLDPADDVFMRGGKSQLADGGKRNDPERKSAVRNPRATDDDDSVLIEASGKKSSNGRGRSSDDDPIDPPARKGSDSSIEQTSEYKKIRARLEAMKATWSSEKTSGGFSVRCEVPHPTDPELAQVFEAKSSDELSALRATVVQAEKWRTGVRRRFDPEEAKLDPFSP
jgi:hypothetical protein